jgi:hypothetical protein
MELLGKAARVFSGIPIPRRGNIGTAMLFERHLLEQMPRVQQPPKIRETFAGPKGKSDLERENCQKYQAAKL